ncbi:MAG: hypothetical protein HYY03_04585, partial [Chloroflexi bacterium]|nr:hypothetical protein [Chloroflexota bacterium]
MEIKVEAGDIAQHPAKAIIVNLFEGVRSPGGATGAVDKALGGGISQLIAEGEIKGKKDELTIIHTLDRLPSPRVLIAGLGKPADFSLNTIRDLTGAALRRLRRAGATRAATIVHGAGIAGLEAAACAQAIAEGAVMGGYRFRRHKHNEDQEKEIESLSIVEFDEKKLAAIRRGVERGQVLGQATNHARDMVNEPANVLTPAAFAERAAALAAEAGLEGQVLERKQMEGLGMGALLG